MSISFVSASVVTVTAAKLCVRGFFIFWCGTPVRLCSQHISFDSKLTTFMAARTHKKLCYVEGGCYMNILFVSGCVVPMTAAKLCVSGFIIFWWGTPVMLC